jgi:ribosomal-protein-serine acetyltransferase
MLRPPRTILIAPGLELRSTLQSQACELLAVVEANRDYLKKWLPWAYHMLTVGQYEGYISSVQKGRRTGEQFSYHISLDGQMIGRATLLRFDRQNKKAEIGYWISAEHQGKGIVTRVTAKLIDVAIHTLDMHRIEVRCAVGNEASAAVPKRLAFEFEGIERHGEFTGTDYRDIQLFSMIAPNWSSNPNCTQ